jgi:hypothetical protein
MVRPDPGDSTNNDPWKPRISLGEGGAAVETEVPRDQLRLAATAMARLHTSSVSRQARPPRTSSAEVKKVRERTLRIATGNPAAAEAVLALGNRLVARLEDAQPDSFLAGHGSFKPTQLLFRGRQAFVIDLDAFGLADPADDVGCFLAYLRPNSLWYRHPGLRSWFDMAAEEFVGAYRQSMLDLNVAAGAIDAILERARVYEGAKLVRIAVRHVTRNNSPRQQELRAICDEISECLSDGARWRSLASDSPDSSGVGLE